MANSKEIGSWLIANSKHLNLSVKNATWIKEWLPEHHNVFVEININGISVSGCSIDKSSDLAFIKAGAEAIERLICVQNNIHSNGVAAHIEIEQAEINARYELLERDSFLSHFISKEPFIKPEKSLLNNILYRGISNKLNDIGIELKVLKMKTAMNFNCIACLCLPINEKGSFSSVIGLGYSSDPVTALEKAIFECLPSMIWHLNGNDSDKILSKNTFCELDSFFPEDHKNLFLGDSYKKEIRDIVEHTNETVEFDNTEMNFSFERLLSPDDFINESPVKVIRAKSEDIQNIFYGPTDISYINIGRLQNFTGKNILSEELNLVPHCIG